MSEEYHVYEMYGTLSDDGYVKPVADPDFIPRAICNSPEGAIEAAEEYESWQFEEDMKVGDRYPHALIFEVERVDDGDSDVSEEDIEEAKYRLAKAYRMVQIWDEEYAKAAIRRGYEALDGDKEELIDDDI
ncbi:hypothetical protein [Natrialba taiwanensis]|uniref:Uncharacterized protein n=1 Tax=Natrialba taiwanensis DSM 12281 TaxID=1230458 RepID=L9ZYR6_9EURY|nr:hypothetical protein [Natrialba taiwanensis]ELY91459.1 hypothetical protein C484_10541 [Natrialba taiwanensis DSM 12281]